MAVPVALTTEEKADAQTQAAPLGLSGDTGPKKKAKKVKAPKGTPKAPKVRLAEEKKPEPAAPAPVAPTASPALAPTVTTGSGREKSSQSVPTQPFRAELDGSSSEHTGNVCASDDSTCAWRSSGSSTTVKGEQQTRREGFGSRVLLSVRWYAETVKDFYVKDAARFENEVITSFFSLSQVSMRERKGGPGQYLALMLTDKTGTLEARMWEEFEAAFKSCGEGCYVKVQGQISKYNGRFQITLTKMRNAAENEVEASDFVPVSEFPVEADGCRAARDRRGFPG